jgi:hypothetical protein
VFETMRRKRRATNMKSELGQSVDHFKRAAALAAQETSATVGPRFNAAKGRMQPAAVKAKGAATSGWDSALATLTPLMAAAAENVRKSDEKVTKASKKAAKNQKKNAGKLEKRAEKAMNRKKSGRKGSKLVGLALIGGAVGAGAAYVMRRRQTAQWDEYEPSRPVTAATATETTGTSGVYSPAPDATVVTDSGDQTQSAQHTPTVAKMAGGQNTTSRTND